MNRYRPPPARDPVPLVTLAVIVLALAVVGAVRWYAWTVDNEDMDRVLVLRAEFGECRNRVLSYPSGRNVPERLEHRLRDIVAEHNSILARHPTWHVEPLDTRALVRVP